ncbi:MAG: tRNA (guanosine(46)-N7)-methyltransferase TrmB [Clostridia bacterium]|nr:tRNA (guanosine(46)-N7)-methyltransferase TrmB [Clostridia bacterium]
MHMRLKKWARPELDACPFYIKEPWTKRGTWRGLFKREAPLRLELGCGKGVSTCQMALNEPEYNFVALDINTSVLGVAKRNAENAFKGIRPVDNLLLANCEIERIAGVFAPEDAVSRIYISFPNPWDQRRRQEKHRLTHTRQLLLYRDFTVPNAEIWFKTDSDELFEDSLKYFPEAGYEIREQTRDLHAESAHPNYITEHEQKFTSQGIKIKALIAVKA